MVKEEIEKLLSENPDELWNKIGPNIYTKTFANVEFDGKLNLPESIEYIEIESFSGSTIKEITIPKSVKIVEPFAISRAGIKSCNIDAELKFLPEGMFSRCEKLSKVKFPDSLKAIKNHVFFGCRHLSKVTFPNGLTEIGEHAFYQTSLRELEIPGSVRKFGINAFGNNTKLEKVVVNDGVNSIKANIFTGCTNLKSTRLPEDTNVVYSLFNDCDNDLVINLGDKCTIGKNAFKVLAIEYDGNVSQIINFVQNNDMNKFNNYIQKEKNVPKFQRIPEFTQVLESGKFQKTKSKAKVKAETKNADDNKITELQKVAEMEQTIQLQSSSKQTPSDSQIVAKSDAIRLIHILKNIEEIKKQNETPEVTNDEQSSKRDVDELKENNVETVNPTPSEENQNTAEKIEQQNLETEQPKDIEQQDVAPEQPKEIESTQIVAPETPKHKTIEKKRKATGSKAVTSKKSKPSTQKTQPVAEEPKNEPKVVEIQEKPVEMQVAKQEENQAVVTDTKVEDNSAPELEEKQSDEADANNSKSFINLKIGDAKLEELTNQKYIEKTKSDRQEVKKSIDAIKTAHPDNYQEYIRELRNSEEYKQALLMWKKHYSEIKEQCKKEVEQSAKLQSSDEMQMGL